MMPPWRYKAVFISSSTAEDNGVEIGFARFKIGDREWDIQSGEVYAQAPEESHWLQPDRLHAGMTYEIEVDGYYARKIGLPRP